MSKRTLLRAAQQAARKAERKLQLKQLTAELPKTMAATAMAGRIYPRTYDPNQVFQDDPDPADNPVEPPPPPSSEARISANRLNAQKSTGPVTPEGKETSCLNALKHGLTGNTVLLDSDDADAYQRHLDAHVDQFKPVTFEERRLVQSIHDAAWRLDRILNLESTIYARGRIELHFCFGEIPEDQRKSFVQLEIAERNAKQLRNLHIQEGRLQRQRAKDIAALRLLTNQRKAEESLSCDKPKPSPVHPAGPVGFEFSTCKFDSPNHDLHAPEPFDKAA